MDSLFLKSPALTLQENFSLSVFQHVSHLDLCVFALSCVTSRPRRLSATLSAPLHSRRANGQQRWLNVILIPLSVNSGPRMKCHWRCVVSELLGENRRPRRVKWICAACDTCGLSGPTLLLLIELSRSVFLVPGDVDYCCASLFTTPGAQTFRLCQHRMENILTHLPLEIRWVASFEVQKFTLKYVKGEFWNVFCVTGRDIDS